MSAKGQSTRAAKDLIDMLETTGEPVRVFCLHDADAAGTMIYQSLQGETIARPRRRVDIVNLGLEPWEAREMGLEDEPVEKVKARRPVAEYVKARGEGWDAWLQSRRYELDSIPPDQFVPWLDAKMAEHDATKAVPNNETLGDEISQRVAAALRDTLRAELMDKRRIDAQLRRIDTQVERAMQRAAPLIDETIAARQDTLEDDVRDALDLSPHERWVSEADEIADEIASRFRWVPPGGKSD